MGKVIENKFFSNGVIEVKKIDRNGVPVGIVKGYIATWDLDRGDWWGTKDQFTKGAFKASIKDFKKRDRAVRFKDHHGRTIGGFPSSTLKEDARGLYAEGEINLEVQQGAEAFSLARQKILVDFSIGFSIEESSLDEQNNIRTITKATIWEGSIVDEPMNPEANITEVKTISQFKDLPLADKDTPWNEEEAIERVKEFTKSEELPSEDYKNGFVIRDKDHEEKFSSYKLLIADVVDDRLVIVPKALKSAASILKTEISGYQLQASMKSMAILHVEKYYAKMGINSPFSQEEKQFFVVDDVKEFTERQLETILRNTGSFSNSAAKYLAGKVAKKELEIPEVVKVEEESTIENKGNEEILNALTDLTKIVKK